MNCERFEARIDELFSTVRFSSPGGRVRVAETPVDIFEVFRLAPEDEEERRYFETMKSGFLDVVEPEYAIQNVFTFHWRGGGESWVNALVLHGGGHLVYSGNEVYPCECLALIEGGASSGAWSRFALDLFGSNGTTYGVEILGLLPPWMVNHRADLIDAAFVKEGCRRFLDGGLGSHRGSAEALRHVRDELISRALEPPSFSGYNALPDYASETAPAIELTREDRQLILDNYFHAAYREEISKPRGPYTPTVYEDEEEEPDPASPR